MLTHLHIQNYALISHLDIDFGQGFSVITGETGAGKSIILGALALVMGARADTKSITEGENLCVIEAEFEECIIRRELNRNGRSRSFVNDEIVSLAELKEWSERLIDIHSQHENLLLGDDNFQINVVDAIAGNQKQMNAYTTAYEKYIADLAALNKLKELAKKSQADADYIEFQFNQLDEANLRSGELEELEEEDNLLANAEEIKSKLASAYNILDGEDYSVLSMLREAQNNSFGELAERLESCYIEIQDIASETESLAERTNIDPERLEEVEERMDLLNSLLHKHHVRTIDELIEIRDQYDEQLQQLANFDDDIAQLEKNCKESLDTLSRLAKDLTDSRKAVVQQISSTIVGNLTKLGVSHAKIDVQISPLQDFMPTGKDDIQFLFAANLNQSLRRVSEIASGGEIARLMLCIKALIADKQALSTIIFDEIDTGVSGEVANKMGEIMQQMSLSRQIIAITHLPQIAAKGQAHYKVFKADTDTRTETQISKLSEDERILEIAGILSGENITSAAIENAKQLLQSAVPTSTSKKPSKSK